MAVAMRSKFPIAFGPFYIFRSLRVIMRSFLSVIRYLAHRFLAMKRSERDKVKTDTTQRHPDPRNDSGNQNERHITGNVHVRGEVEINLAPNLIDKRDTERNQDNTRDDNKFFWNTLIQACTLFAVIVHAGLTAWQACSTQQAAYAAKTAADTAVAEAKASHLGL
jgi:hypothetical protein